MAAIRGGQVKPNIVRIEEKAISTFIYMKCETIKDGNKGLVAIDGRPNGEGPGSVQGIQSLTASGNCGARPSMKSYIRNSCSAGYGQLLTVPQVPEYFGNSGCLPVIHAVTLHFSFGSMNSASTARAQPASF